MNYAMKGKRRWHVIEHLVKQHGWTAGVELGVLKGDTMLYLLRQCPDLCMFGVDIWEPQPEQEAVRDAGGRSYQQHPLNRYYADLKKRVPPGRLMRMRTDEAARKFKDETLDFVFIDADHTSEGVRADIENWLPKVKRGGAVMGHDLHFPSVKSVVDEMLPKYETHPDHVYVWWKP
jgi:hypothetical protein